MSAPIIAFFNNKSGVGKTTLVYHLAWMFADLDVKVLAVDRDPQANLTDYFIGGGLPNFDPDLKGAALESLASVVNPNLVLFPSGLRLSLHEEDLATQWERALQGSELAFDALSAPWRMMRALASLHESQLILVDLGPNLSAINRAGLMAADHVIIPLLPDLLTVMGLESAGLALRTWREGWQERLAGRPSEEIELPSGHMTPLGYVVRQPSVTLKAEEDWYNRIAEYYQKFVLGKPIASGISVLSDPEKLAILRPYPTSLEMAFEARKPMFHLKPADGAIGAHLQSAEDARRDFEALAKAIVAKAKLSIVLSS